MKIKKNIDHDQIISEENKQYPNNLSPYSTEIEVYLVYVVYSDM